MAARLNPYINFTGNAREALEFYRDVFGGELRISTFGQFGQPDSPSADQVMHGQLETPMGFTLMAADTPAEMKTVTTGNNVVICISGDDADQLREYWTKLAETGKVNTPLEQQVWGDVYGDLVDQFGIEWMVDIVQPRS